MVVLVKNLTASATDVRLQFDPWVRKIPWSRKWQLIPAFLARKFHGQRNLVGFSPRGGKEWDVTEHVCMCGLLTLEQES